MQSLAKEVKQELTGRIVPFWEGLRDEEYGGFYNTIFSISFLDS